MLDNHPIGINEHVTVNSDAKDISKNASKVDMGPNESGLHGVVRNVHSWSPTLTESKFLEMTLGNPHV